MPAAPSWYRRREAGLDLRIVAKTRCRDEGLGEITANGVIVRVNAPPAEGRANRRILEVVAEAFGVAGSRVRLIRGMRSRHKWVHIERPARVPEPLNSALQGGSRG